MKNIQDNIDALENQSDAPIEPGIEPDADDAAPQSDPYREFMADRRTLRYEDTPENKRKLYDYLLKFEPPLPLTAPALYLAFDELRKQEQIELTPFARPATPDMKTAGQKSEEERAEAQSSSPDIEQQAKIAARMFRDSKREMIHHRNGRRVGGQTG